MLPPWVPASVKLVKNARRLAGACSNDVELALDCSPATARPWNTRSTRSRIGAATPIWSYVGSSPIRNVARPIPNRVRKSTVLRPIVSPRCPSTKEPTGRATYATPKVAREAIVAAAALPAGKKIAGKTSAAAVP